MASKNSDFPFWMNCKHWGLLSPNQCEFVSYCDDIGWGLVLGQWLYCIYSGPAFGDYFSYSYFYLYFWISMLWVPLVIAWEEESVVLCIAQITVQMMMWYVPQCGVILGYGGVLLLACMLQYSCTWFAVSVLSKCTAHGAQEILLFSSLFFHIFSFCVKNP